VAACEFDLAYTFIFSPRAGTRAATMADSFVASDVIKARFERLKDVTDRSALRRHEARVAASKRFWSRVLRRNDQMLSGRTRQGN